MITDNLTYKVLSRLQLVIFIQVPDKKPAFIYAEHHITPRKVRRIWSKERGALEGNTAAPISTTSKLSTKNVVQVCRRVDIENLIISRNNSISLVESFDIPVNFTVCLFNRINAILKKPNRKLALDRTPHTLNSALSLRRPR